MVYIQNIQRFSGWGLRKQESDTDYSTIVAEIVTEDFSLKLRLCKTVGAFLASNNQVNNRLIRISSIFSAWSHDQLNYRNVIKMYEHFSDLGVEIALTHHHVEKKSFYPVKQIHESTAHSFTVWARPGLRHDCHGMSDGAGWSKRKAFCWLLSEFPSDFHEIV